MSISEALRNHFYAEYLDKKKLLEKVIAGTVKAKRKKIEIEVGLAEGRLRESHFNPILPFCELLVILKAYERKN